MGDTELLRRIQRDPDVMLGKPVIAGTRLTVEFVLNLLAHGETKETIVAEYDGLTPDDVLACILFAAKALEDTTFVPFAAGEARGHAA
ncbi:MAG: DUF433 domain-containing protein [Gammaproteobacteria bacterium]|nr:DUF433 domain-containing protein [Gammaproteobacteria bacterium]MYB38790.1 DUF433 domain-containing protein [Gammaproteobacteria bacterium]